MGSGYSTDLGAPRGELCVASASQLLVWGGLQVLVKYVPTGFFGEDRDGHPIYYDCFGNLDFKGWYVYIDWLCPMDTAIPRFVQVL